MGTHQYRLCTQLKIETLLLISKHELLVIYRYTQLLVRIPSKGYTYLSICVPENDMDTHQYQLCTQLRVEPPLQFTFADF